VAEKRAVYGSGTDGGANGGGDWAAFKAFVKGQDPILCSKIEMGKCLACEEGLLRIGFERDSANKDHLFVHDVKEKQDELAGLAGRFFRRETALEIESLAPETNGGAPGGNGPNGRAAKNHHLQEIRREALSHPLVQKVLDVFPGARVKEVRLREIPAAEASPAPVHLRPDEEGLPPFDETPGPPDDGPEDD